jgi:hypothetical protein
MLSATFPALRTKTSNSCLRRLRPAHRPARYDERGSVARDESPPEFDKATNAMIDEAVTAALKGPHSLEHLISVALFGRPPRGSDPAWSKHHRDIFFEAVHRFMLRRGRMETPNPNRRSYELKRSLLRGDATRASINIADMWALVLEFAGDRWYKVPGLGWKLIGQRFGLNERDAQYRIVDVQGWRFTGVGRQRKITRAPCVECRVPTSYRSIVNQRCAKCDGRSQ